MDFSWLVSSWLTFGASRPFLLLLLLQLVGVGCGRRLAWTKSMSIRAIRLGWYRLYMAGTGIASFQPLPCYPHGMEVEWLQLMLCVTFSELCEVHRANPRRAMAQLQSSGAAHPGHPDAAAPSPATPPSESP
ncbi:hypothetical protein U9M48_043615 [Paspalum notatum var. saurae]|uniref:Uncharacterized protein n=1 Tax=Paspalum notatum var. saurae TaxID=547442 RepID=A0AAQ3UT47_PASNO